MTVMNLVQAVNSGLKCAMGGDGRVVVLGEDVGVDGGVFRATDGLLKQFGRQRVMDTPLAESGIIGVSIGMAAAGLRPVPEIQFSGFLYMAFAQLVNHAARMRMRSRGAFSCPLVIRTPYGGGIRALEHHSESMEAVFAHVPGIKVVIPSSPYDAKGLLISAIQDADPVVFMEPSRLYRAVKEDVPEDSYTVPIGKAKVVKEGSALTVISWGSMLQQAKLALNHTDVDAELIDLRTLKPLDTDAITASVKKTGRCVIVQEAPRTGGFASEVITVINDKALLSLKAPVSRVTGFDTGFPLYKLENHYLPSVERIVAAIEAVANY
ncbi:alpha-ketoacid dehydrogenase subunit beta [Candidatus Woesearchaeota archaeon]|nr:alpha-ketoacid dehydrogenase subunit beta [Candidatus Woesearchaeota archaeon]